MRSVTEGNGSHAPQADLRHLKAVARVLTGRAPSIAEVAEREGIDAGYVRRLMRLAFLAPKVVETIAAGRQPSKRTAESTERIDLPLLWAAQEEAVGR
jgi:site-specific DNA recombinase